MKPTLLLQRVIRTLLFLLLATFPSAASHAVNRAGQGNVASTRQAMLDSLDDVSVSTRRIAQSLSRLKIHRAGIGGRSVFAPYLAYGERQLHWLEAARLEATRLTDAAKEVHDPAMQKAIVRLAGPRLEALLGGVLLLEVWVDFLNLADVVLQQCPFYSVEALFMDMERARTLLEPSLEEFSSLRSERIEATATALPGVMAQLTHEFHSTRESIRAATALGERWVKAAQLVEMLTLVSTLKLSLPRLPPAAPALLGTELVVSAGGVVMGTRVVVSVEWVERMRQLVQAGVISAPVVVAAVRVHAGQVLMTRAHDELPQGVRDALGDGPEVGAMRQTGRTGAGMAEAPRHHVLPREHREWFEKRGFTGEMDIDQFCVELEQAQHEALHGGGNWRLGRKWPGEWNQDVMRALNKAETRTGRMLTRNEVLDIVAEVMGRFDLPVNFVPWRGR